MRRIIPILLAFLLVESAAAHDYWLAPADYRPAVGKAVDVRLFVGDKFDPEIERQFKRSRTVRFQLLDRRGKSLDLLTSGREGEKPMLYLELPQPGAYLLSMQRDWSLIEMTAEKFHKYLEHEGLGSVIELRKQAGEADQAASERYRRYLKSLLLADGVGGDTWRRQLGHRLEILPLADPSLVKPGTTLPVRVLFESRPLADVQVAAMGRDGEDKVTVVRSRTDKKGQAELKIDHAGEWIVRLVYLRRCTEPKEADWESFWAAMTFEVTSSPESR
jgi:uncharacterized GH25 family protein